MSKSADKKAKKSISKEKIDQFLLNLKGPEVRKKVEQMIKDNLDTELISEMSLRKIGLGVLDNIENVRESLNDTAAEVEKKVKRSRAVRTARVASKITQRELNKAKKSLERKISKESK